MIQVVKIGGNVIDSPENLGRFLDDFARLPQPAILVHGGGKEATRMCARLGIETKMIEGRRVTDAQTLDVVTMVYAGLINKRIVAMLQARGVNAIGLCGADANVIPSTRRSPIPQDYGYVGDIDAAKVNDQALKALLDAGMVPVICAITRSDEPANGLLLNSNADSVACAVASAATRIAPVKMHYCFEKAGVLADVDNPDSLIETITPDKFVELKGAGVIHSGMIPKIQNALGAVKAGVSSVIIKSSEALLSNRGTCVIL